MKRPYTANEANRHRSAIAPVGIVAAVSMNTAVNRNIVRFAGSCGALSSANRAAPNRP